MISNFPSGWKELRLSELGVCIRGVSYDPDVDLRVRDSSDTARLLRSNNVQDGSLNLKSLQFVSTTRVSSQQNMTSGDVLICMANGSKQLVGKAARFDIKGAHKYTFGAFMGIFRPLDKMDSDFIFFLMQSKKYRDFLDIVLSGSSINNLRPSNILEMTFLIPERDERRKISDALVDMDLLVRNLDKLIAKKRNIKQASMQKLWSQSKSWNQIEVNQVLLDHFSGPSPTCEERNIRGSEWGVLRTTCTTWEYGWNWKSHKVLPRSYWGQESRKVRVGDTIITKAGPRHRVGVPSFVDFVPDNIVPSGKMIALRPNPSLIDPLFLSLALKEHSSQAYLNERTTGMAESQVNFENRALLGTLIKVPSLAEQMRIAEVSTSIDAEINALVALREKTALIQIGMMQELLTGRTRLL